MSTPVPGSSLGTGHVLHEMLGWSPLGSTWSAAAPDGSPVVIKVLATALGGDPDIVTRFTRQHPALTELRSGQVAQRRELIVDEPHLALVSDPVDGENLRSYLRRSLTLPPALAFELAGQVLQGLSAVHYAGLLHQDLKPENVLIDLRDPDHPRAVLSDAGVVSAVGPMAYPRLGASRYRAPEQGPERPETVAVDVYGTGALLLEMITGLPPEPAAAMLPVISGLPLEAATAMTSMLSTDPANRPRSAAVARGQLISASEELIGVEALAPVPGAAEWQGVSDETVPVPASASSPGVEDPSEAWSEAELRGLAAQDREPAPKLAVPGFGSPPPPGYGATEEPRTSASGLRSVLAAGLALLVLVLVVGGVAWWRLSASDDTNSDTAAPASATSQASPQPAETVSSSPSSASSSPSASTSGLSAAELRRLPTSAPADLASPDWGSVRDIASAFPNIVPSDPSDPGPDGQACANVKVESDFSTGKVRCEYPDGQVMSLQSYASTADRNTRAGQIKAEDGVKESIGWRVGTGEAQRNGTLVTGVTSDGQPWRWWTYDQADRFAIYVRWPGHSTDDLADWWNKEAPFLAL